VRIIEISGIDMNPCCGTHLPSTAQMQMVKFIKAGESRGAEGVGGGAQLRHATVPCFACVATPLLHSAHLFVSWDQTLSGVQSKADVTGRLADHPTDWPMILCIWLPPLTAARGTHTDGIRCLGVAAAARTSVMPEPLKGHTLLHFAVGGRLLESLAAAGLRERGLNKLLCCAPSDYVAKVEKIAADGTAAARAAKRANEELAQLLGTQLRHQARTSHSHSHSPSHSHHHTCAASFT
jgi:hypothetical protein